MSRIPYGRQSRKVRFAPSGMTPPGANLDNDPRRVSPDPNGSRAQRRLAKRQGITTSPDRPKDGDR
ncbi:hypothetical protein ACIBTV_27520 [Micromonospora sp. NPDC049366]|uniref:hypothetical protein n=1 Tax=Micromonospora sp. NPDC049366 TaxID=3364271 RepID=UPI003787F07C